MDTNIQASGCGQGYGQQQGQQDDNNCSQKKIQFGDERNGTQCIAQ